MDSNVRDLVANLATAYRDVDSVDALHETTVNLVSRHLPADASVLATETDGDLQPAAMDPPDWTDADDLLSPVSLPSVALGEGESLLIDDRADVRCATTGARTRPDATVTYRSVLAVPFGDGDLLVACARVPRSFSSTDLQLVQHISVYAAARRKALESTTRASAPMNSLDEVAAVLSHDATNFLAIIQGHLELARDGQDQVHFDKIERASNRLEAVLDDAVTLLRSGSRAVDYELVPMVEVTTTAWDVAPTADASLSVGLLGTVRADRAQLTQLLENLFRNAVDHGGNDVTVWVGPLDDADGFAVEDTGPGIDAADVESVFEPGYSTGVGNTGFGLAIVRSIATAHDWEVAVTEGATGGARFEFTGVELVDQETSDV